ncbi:MAG: hypothetical protein ABSH07_11505 [Candidatus Dormibacteria bacterium]
MTRPSAAISAALSRAGHRTRAEGHPAVVACLASLTLLGPAILLNIGDISTPAMLLVLLALGAALLALAGAGRSPWDQRAWVWVAIIVLVGVTNLRYLWWPQGVGSDWPVHLVLILALIAAAAGAAALPAHRAGWALAGAAILWLGLIASTWPSWGSANIDVFQAISGAIGALLHGGNPYGPVFSYLAPISPTRWGTVTGHFAYGPIVPVLASLGWLLGDLRVMSVVAIASTLAGLWVLARQGSQPASAHRIVALALVSPFTVAMVQSAWVEVYLVAGVVWWMALCHHRRAWSVVALAIALLVNAITLVVLVPAFLWSRRARVEIVIAAGIAVIVALPFALVTGVGAFVYDVIGIQLAPPACRRVTRGATGTVSR